MPAKKPYYKLTIGAKPYTSADMKFPCGRIRIEVSDAHPDARNVMSGLFDIHWDKACCKVLDFFNNAPPTPIDAYARGEGVRLTEPEDQPLRNEVARLRALKEAKNG